MVHPRGREGQCLMQDVTFLHCVVVEAPGEPRGIWPEAAPLLFTLLSRDAGEAAVYPGVKVVGTNFPHCIKKKQGKEGDCYFMLHLLSGVIQK